LHAKSLQGGALVGWMDSPPGSADSDETLHRLLLPWLGMALHFHPTYKYLCQICSFQTTYSICFVPF